MRVRLSCLQSSSVRFHPLMSQRFYAHRLIALCTVLAVCAALVLSLPPALAADPPPLQCNKSTACELQIYIENDSFGNGTDRYYTNGIKFGGGVNADRLIERLLQTPARSALERISDHLGEVHVGLFLGQNLYTPQRITVSQPQPLEPSIRSSNSKPKLWLHMARPSTMDPRMMFHFIETYLLYVWKLCRTGALPAPSNAGECGRRC